MTEKNWLEKKKKVKSKEFQALDLLSKHSYDLETISAKTGIPIFRLNIWAKKNNLKTKRRQTIGYNIEV